MHETIISESEQFDTRVIGFRFVIDLQSISKDVIEDEGLDLER